MICKVLKTKIYINNKKCAVFGDYDTVVGLSALLEELGEIPSGYSKVRPYIISEEKANLLDKVNLIYIDAQDEDIKIKDFVGNISARTQIEELKRFIGENEFGRSNFCCSCLHHSRAVRYPCRCAGAYGKRRPYFRSGDCGRVCYAFMRD